MKKIYLFLLAALFIFSFHAFAQEEYPRKRPSASAGKNTFDKQCASCHGINGDGKGPVAKSLKPSPTDFTDHLQMRLKSPAELYTVVVKGKGAMPAFNNLKDKDAWDIVYYLITFSNTKDMVAKGKKIYYRDCAFCHGKTGIGDGPGGAGLPMKPRNFADLRWMAWQKDGALYQNMAMGIPTSGIACAANLKADERWNVLAYIRAFTYDN